MSSHLEQQKQTMLQIKDLNEQIVEARRQGQHQRVEALKQKVQDMLIMQSMGVRRKPKHQETNTSTEKQSATPSNPHDNNEEFSAKQGGAEVRDRTPQAGQKPSPSNQSIGSETHSSENSESNSNTLSAKDLMAQIQALNLEIVAARKQGQLDRAAQLQEEVKNLMMQGVALR